MKVLYVLRSDSWGGLELYSFDLIKKLRAQGVDATLLCKRNSRLEKEARASGLPITFNRFSLWKKYDVIHVLRRKELPLVRLSLLCRSKVKFIYSLMMNAPPKKDLYHRWIYSRVDALLSSSELLNENVRKNFPLAPNKVHLVRYGRDQHVSRLNEQDIRIYKASQNFSTEKKIFGTLCRIDPGKGVRELAQSLTLLSDEQLGKLELWLVGEPTLLKTENGRPIYTTESAQLYKELISLQKNPRYQNTLRIIPYQKNPNAVLSSMDVFVLATNKEETYSLAVIDAMLLGLPIIGTEAGGTIEQIGKNQARGVFIKPNSSESIAAAIAEYLKNPQKILAQKNAIQQWARSEHDWMKTVSQTIQLYKL